MRTATAAPTPKATTVAQAPIFSIEKHHSDNSDNIVGDSNSNVTNDRNGNSYDVIGASLLSFLHHDGSNSNHQRKHDSSGDATMRNDAIPETGERYFHKNTNNVTRSTHQNDCASLLLDGGRTYTAPSTTTTVDNSQQQIRRRPLRRKRILLRGPPRSGKSSLGMDLAYAEAEAEKDCCGGLPCDCVAAIVYRPKGRRHTDNHHRNNSNSNYYDYDDENDDTYSSNGEQFPLFCRSLPTQTVEVPADTTNDRTKEGLQAATALKNAEAAATATKRDEDDTWDPNTLNRIRVCRVSSVRDLWEDMLALAGKPLHERPTRAIIVEDLDQIIVGSGGDHNQNSGSSSGNNKKHNNYTVSMMLKTGEYR